MAISMFIPMTSRWLILGSDNRSSCLSRASCCYLASHLLLYASDWCHPVLFVRRLLLIPFRVLTESLGGWRHSFLKPKITTGSTTTWKRWILLSNTQTRASRFWPCKCRSLSRVAHLLTNAMSFFTICTGLLEAFLWWTERHAKYQAQEKEGSTMLFESTEGSGWTNGRTVSCDMNGNGGPRARREHQETERWFYSLRSHIGEREKGCGRTLYQCLIATRGEGGSCMFV